MQGFCRDCLADAGSGPRCGACGSPRLVRHAELHALSVAHVDCDAFYATIEKRDDPSLADKPLIIGGGTRGVVSTACYIARTYGVHSAMPMFKARRLCPDAVVVRPNMQKYAAVAREVRALHARSDPHGRAGFDRRGVPRPVGDAAPAWPEPRAIACAICSDGRERHRHHVVDRAVLQQVSRQDRIRPRQAARLCNARARRSAAPFSRRSRFRSSSASAR